MNLIEGTTAATPITRPVLLEAHCTLLYYIVLHKNISEAQLERVAVTLMLDLYYFYFLYIFYNYYNIIIII